MWRRGGRFDPLSREIALPTQPGLFTSTVPFSVTPDSVEREAAHTACTAFEHRNGSLCPSVHTGVLAGPPSHRCHHWTSPLCVLELVESEPQLYGVGDRVEQP